MTRFCSSLLAGLMAILLAALPMRAQNFPGASGNPSILSRPGGGFYAPAFFWQTARVLSGNSSTGSATITVVGSTGGQGGLQLPDGTTISLQTVFNTLTPIVVDWGQGNAEWVTPTAVSVSTCPAGNLGVGGVLQCVSFTGSFTNTHGQNAVVVDGTYGAQTAINYAQSLGGGVVTIDPAWAQMVSGVPNITGAPATVAAVLTSLIPYGNVVINDQRAGQPPWWGPQSNATFLAVPATDTGTTVGITVNGANATGGFYTNANPYHTCRAYVDLMGNEGPCSLDFSFTPASGTTNQIGWKKPAASAGAAGWVAYISLTNGSYALAYRVPGCPGGTVTTLETVIAACAVDNTTYNQTGSGMVVSALTLNTARIAAQLGAASTTTDIVSNSAGHTVYTYAPGAPSPAPLTSYAPFTITTAAASTVPAILGTIQLPAGFMNFVGRTVRVCGKATQASNGSTATIETIQLIWDADGSNTTGAGVIIGVGETLTSTLVTANADDYNFCEVLRTTVSGAGVTACSIQDVTGWLIVDGAQVSTSNRAAGNNSVGTTGSLNCAGEARIDVQYVHTTGTDANGLILQNLTLEVLN